MTALANLLRWYTIMASFALDGAMLALLFQSKRILNEPPRWFARAWFVATIVLFAYVQETAYERLGAPMALRTLLGTLGVSLQAGALLGMWAHYRRKQRAALRESRRQSESHRSSATDRSSAPGGSA